MAPRNPGRPTVSSGPDDNLDDFCTMTARGLIPMKRPIPAVTQTAHRLAIIKRFNRIAGANDAAFLNPAIEARSIVQWQIERHAEKFLEILAGEIKSPAKQDGGPHAEALSYEV